MLNRFLATNLKVEQDLRAILMGRGGGQVVSVLAFCSDDPSSNPS